MTRKPDESESPGARPMEKPGAILVEENDPTAKDRRRKRLNQSGNKNSTLNSRGGNKILLLSGTTKSKMMERTGGEIYNHNAYYDATQN
jgi:hypothetical protein